MVVYAIMRGIIFDLSVSLFVYFGWNEPVMESGSGEERLFLANGKRKREN